MASKLETAEGLELLQAQLQLGALPLTPQAKSALNNAYPSTTEHTVASHSLLAATLGPLFLAFSLSSPEGEKANISNSSLSLSAPQTAWLASLSLSCSLDIRTPALPQYFVGIIG